MRGAPIDVIAVLDLKGGQVVHAVAGNREKYQPVQSILCDSAEINDVVEGMVRKLGISTFYIADLDAISGQEGNLEKISHLIQTYKNKEYLSGKTQFFFDAGVTDIQGVEKLLTAQIDKVIIGTETLLSLTALQDILARFGADKIILSLDLRHGKVLTKTQELKMGTPLEGLTKLLALGLKNVMLIELDRVGTGKGLNKELILGALQLMNEYGEGKCSLFLGGGVGSLDEILTLRAWGIHGVMLATMLHRGTLNHKKIQSLIR